MFYLELIKMKSAIRIFIPLTFSLLLSCGQNEKGPEKPIFQNKGHELVYEMTQKTGGYAQLLALKDVTYAYIYRTPDKKEDVSIEKYIFDGELSFGTYSKHERTLPDLNGKMDQGYDGTSFWLKINDEIVSDSALIDKVAFTRKTNFYWFAMMQKLLDPGIIYEYLRQESIDGKTYDVVAISYDSKNNEATDTYQLYINTETSLVDQFLFTVMARNVTDPLLMRVEYERIDGIMIPTYRKYTKSDWNGKVIKDQWVEEISTDIKFNQNIQKATFINR